MTPAILTHALTDGLTVSLDGCDRLRVRGPAAAVSRWLPLLREHKQEIIAALAANDEPPVSHWWRLHFADREPLETAFTPPVSRAEALACYPDATHAEPFEPTAERPARPLTGDEESAILAWLAQIGETDQEIIADMLDRCRRDAAARRYFLGRAAEKAPPDDRRTCNECAHLAANGRCLAAWRGEIVASRTYEPIRDLPRRCEGFAPRSLALGRA